MTMMPSKDCTRVERHLDATPPPVLRDMDSAHGEESLHIGLVLQEVDAADDENGGLRDMWQQVGEGGGIPTGEGYASHRREEETRAQHHHLLPFHHERPVETPVVAHRSIDEFPRDEVEASLLFPPLSR